MSEHWHDPECWLKRAQEARAIVKHLGEPYAKLQMIMIAEAYSHLAQHAQKRATSNGDVENFRQFSFTD
jgi:hypothetical protein